MAAGNYSIVDMTSVSSSNVGRHGVGPMCQFVSCHRAARFEFVTAYKTMDLPILFIISSVLCMASPSDALATKPKSSKTSSTGIKPSSTGSKQSSTGLQPSSTGNKPSATGSKPTVQGGSADDGSSSPNNNPIPSWDDVDPRQSVPGKKTGSTGDDADPLGDAENAPGKKPTPGGDDSDYADTRQNTAGEKPIGSTFNRDGDEPGLAGSSNPGLTKRPNLTTRKPISTTGRPTSSTWGPVVGANQLSPVEAEGRSADGAPRNAELSQERQDDRPGPVRNGSTLPTVSLVITLAALGMIETTLWNRCQ
ncbi:unnamed protein product [Lymnaea stagnalis]|uniref:Uncharacterized protein n=1 Tax=Lymnaea stagnalis TaxID=6523 RepID=A0AAV2IF66_LYMST